MLDDGACYRASAVSDKQRWENAVAACGTGAVASVPTARVNELLGRMCAMAACWPGHTLHPSSWAGLIAPYMSCGSKAECWIGLRSEDPRNGRPFQWAGACHATRQLCWCSAHPRPHAPAILTDNGPVEFTAWKSRVR